MAIYTFYLCDQDGRSISFEAFELGDDMSVPDRALKLLGEHPSSASVAVWDGDRPILERRRAAAFHQSEDHSEPSVAPSRALVRRMAGGELSDPPVRAPR